MVTTFWKVIASSRPAIASSAPAIVERECHRGFGIALCHVVGPALLEAGEPHAAYMRTEWTPVSRGQQYALVMPVHGAVLARYEPLERLRSRFEGKR